MRKQKNAVSPLRLMFESAGDVHLLDEETLVIHLLENTTSVAPRGENSFGMFPRAVRKLYTSVDIGRKGEINA